MSRLQAGGLALLLKTNNPENLMKTVKLINFIGYAIADVYGARNDYWEIDTSNIDIYNPHNKQVVQPAQYLLPLGDEEGRKLYKLEEEKLEKQDDLSVLSVQT